ncbi:MAG: hypothetical protein IPG22_20725 [Acidobacteria bacterium]|nr:hypothetical protein [Acidobacteriota bacterium]
MFRLVSNPEIAGSLYVRRDEYILAYFVAGRRVDLHNVSTVTTEDEFASQLASNVDPRRFVASFKQYLVNKKIYEAFDFIAKKRNSESAKFFTRFTSILRQILKDPKLELIFEQESFEFYLHLSDGRRLTFNQLSDGFSAFLNILMDLLMRAI